MQTNNNMIPNQEKKFYQELIKELLKTKNPTYDKLNQIKIKLAKKYQTKEIAKNSQIIANTPENKKQKIIKILNTKPVRELSGVTVVALFAKPHPCPHGKCIYCPGGIKSHFGNTPQSYTGKEPAALRAIRNNYDPYLQIFNRLEHYIINGHFPDKIELIFMGGTFPSLNKKYTNNFTRLTYKAINDFADQFIQTDKHGKKQINHQKFHQFFETDKDMTSKKRQNSIRKKILTLKKQNSKTLEQEIKRNETSKIRSIGLTIETRPDWAEEKHCKQMLKYGCTRLEIGVQTTDENCLKKINRGHTIQQTKKAFQIAKDMCLKINAHIMIGLPYSNQKTDETTLKELFQNPAYRPDMLKIYPCLVVKGTKLYELYKKGKFTPLTTTQASKIIANAYKYIPRYTRVMRIQRDTPTTITEQGIEHSNLRQYVDQELQKQKITPLDIRAREIGLRQLKGQKVENLKIKIQQYESSNGTEHFIDACDKNDTLLGFIRLRFPSKYGYQKAITKGTALIRELHIYGNTTPVGKKGKHQHKGWGKKLLSTAEKIAKKHGYNKIAIISGIGVREYYKKLGYNLEGTYMTKKI